MACIISEGYALGCRDNVGGIQNALIATFDSTVVYTVDVSNQIDSITTCPTYYTFAQENETGDFTETASISNENGTVFYEQSVTMTFHKATAAIKNQIKLLAQANLSLIILDQAGIYHLIGKQNGVRVTEVAGGVGKAYGDLNGYTVTFMGKEPEPAVTIDNSGSIITIG